MKLARHPGLDALCGEYLLGTLRGAARRRFETALRDEPLVAARLRHWEATATPRFATMMELQPPTRIWQRLERGLQLSRYRAPWYQRTGFWKAWAAAASAAALLLVVAVNERQARPLQTVEIAQLSAKDGSTRVSAQRSRDGRVLVLKSNRPVLAGPNQSYELWLIPAQSTVPISVAVLGSLDTSFVLAPERSAQLHAGATLAISTEPAGGSPTGQPTGAVILAGKVTT